MTDYRVPQEDVERAESAIMEYLSLDDAPFGEYGKYRAAHVLAAVLPAHDRALILALAEKSRRAVNGSWVYLWLLDQADQIDRETAFNEMVGATEEAGLYTIVDVSHDMKIDDPLLDRNRND